MTYPFHFTSTIHTALKRKITHFVRGFSLQLNLNGKTQYEQR